MKKELNLEELYTNNFQVDKARPVLSQMVEWVSGQYRKTVNLLPSGFVGSNPTSTTNFQYLWRDVPNGKGTVC